VYVSCAFVTWEVWKYAPRAAGGRPGGAKNSSEGPDVKICVVYVMRVSAVK